MDTSAQPRFDLGRASIDELEARVTELRIAAGLPADRTVFTCCMGTEAQAEEREWDERGEESQDPGDWEPA